MTGAVVLKIKMTPLSISPQNMEMSYLLQLLMGGASGKLQAYSHFTRVVCTVHFGSSWQQK